MIKLIPEFKFDIIIAFNTLRASEEQWGQENYNQFISWCSKYGKYLIANNCTNRHFDNFKLIDSIQVPGFYDTNLFKSC